MTHRYRRIHYTLRSCRHCGYVKLCHPILQLCHQCVQDYRRMKQSWRLREQVIEVS